MSTFCGAALEKIVFSLKPLSPMGPRWYCLPSRVVLPHRKQSIKLASWPYVFINLSYSDWYQLPVLAEMLEAKLARTPKAYVVHIEGEHGDEYLAVAKDNFDVVGNVEIPFDPSAYAPQVR